MGNDADRRGRDPLFGPDGQRPERRGQTNDSPHAGRLTDAEQSVVQLLAHGFSNAMIAEMLNKSEKTIQNQIRSAKAALNAKTPAHLVSISLRQHLID